MVFKYKAEEQDKFSPDTGESFIKVPKDKLFLPQPQQYRLRVLPPWSPQGLFAKYAKIHWGIGATMLRTVCPDLYTSGTCPFCKVFHQMRAVDWKAYQEDITAIRPQDRFYSNIVNLSEPHKGVQVWSFGKIIYRLLKGIQDSGDFGDITDADTGSDINLTRTGQGRNVQDTIYPVRNPSKLANPQWLNELFDLDNIFKDPDLEAIQDAFESHPWKTDFVQKNTSPVVRQTGMAFTKAPSTPIQTVVNTVVKPTPVEQPNGEDKSNGGDDRYARLNALEQKLKSRLSKTIENE